MNEQIVDVYYRKKYLVRSFTIYLFSLFVWLSIYFVFVFQLILNRHPNVGEFAHFIYSAILTFIFMAWATKFIRILIGCVSQFRSAPNIAYSLNEEGVRSHRKGWFISWQDIYDATSTVQNKGFFFHKTKRSGHSMNNWGIDPREMELAKNLILQKLPESKTKRLR